MCISSVKLDISSISLKTETIELFIIRLSFILNKTIKIIIIFNIIIIELCNNWTLHHCKNVRPKSKCNYFSFMQHVNKLFQIYSNQPDYIQLHIFPINYEHAVFCNRKNIFFIVND